MQLICKKQDKLFQYRNLIMLLIIAALVAIPSFAFLDSLIQTYIDGIKDNTTLIVGDVVNGIKNKNTEIFGHVANGLNITKKVGYSMIVIFFGYDFYEKATSDSFNVEHLIKQLLKAVIGTLFIDESLNICKALADLSFELYNAIETGVGNPEFADINFGDHPFLGFLESVLFAVLLLIVYLLSFLAKGFIAVLVAGIYVEFYVRAVFFPIAAADAFGGSRQGAIKYLRTMMAMAMQMGVVLMSQVIIGIMTHVLSGIFDDLIGKVVIALLMIVAQIGFIMKTGSIAKDMVGG